MYNILYKKNSLLFMIAYLAVYSTNYYFGKNQLYYLPLFIIAFNLIKSCNQINDSRIKIISIFSAIVLASFQAIGYQLANNIKIDVFDSVSSTLHFILNFLGIIVIFYFILIFLFNYMLNKGISDGKFDFKYTNKTNFLIFWILILLCWMPYLIINYPGILSPDSIAQIRQIMGDLPFNDNEPAFHTMLVMIIVKTGFLFFKDINTCILLFSILQMLVMTAIFSYSLSYMLIKKINSNFVIMSFLYFAFYPVNAVYSVSIWPDVLFSGSILIYLILLLEIINNTENFFVSKYKWASLFFVSLFMILVRHNGIYMFFITSFVLTYIINPKYRKIFITISLTIFLIFLIIKIPLYNYLKIIKTPISSALSIPIQQISRTVNYHKEDLTKRELDKIHRYFYNEFEKGYDPTICDPVRKYFVVDNFISNKGDFFKLWLELFIKYPKTYIESFLYSSYGYWYPDTKYWILGGYIQENEYGIKQNKLLPKTISQSTIIKIVDKIRRIPLVSLLFSIGFIVWLMLFSSMYCLLTFRYNLLILFLPLFILWLTALASPVYAEFRYVYGIFVSTPLIVGISIFQKKE